MANYFEELLKVNVNDKIEKRKGDNGKDLSYLSWAFAWTEFKKIYPEATYTIQKFDGKPFCYDKDLGYMVMTTVSANNETLEMWLPVMDSKNKAMKEESYQYTTKYGTKSVEKASMFDVNKAIMRCLVKNIAMFGLGLYIYAGEDLPEDDDDKPTQPNNKPSEASLGVQIENCKTEEELSALYNKNKSAITSNDNLLQKMVARGKELKQVA